MFDKLSIRHKLIILLSLSAALALLVSSAITVYSTYVSESKDSLRLLRQMTDVISENMRAALAFHDADSARNMLAPLHINRNILMAVVRDESGKKLAEYQSPGLSAADAQMFSERLQMRIAANIESLRRESGFVEYLQEDFMGVIRPIFFEDKLIGTLAIISDTEMMHAKIHSFVLVQIVASLLTLALLLFLSLGLQAMFTRPIIDLIAAMKSIAETKNYRYQLNSQRKDEFNDLYQGFSAMLADIRERDERLSKLATSDALTGLANRRHAMETMETMVTRAQRKGEPLGVIMLDVDFFKKVNDRYGHPVGDIVLKKVAQILQASAREYDLVARIGGEEFLVLCDNATIQVAKALAERIRSGVEGCSIEYETGKQLSVTISLGIYSALPSLADLANNGEDLIKVADEALYRAKEGGRNRYEIGTRNNEEKFA